MRPGFQLNNHSRTENPCFESHDPSMMWNPISEMYYSYSTDTGVVSEFRQGIQVRKSRNLIDFEFVGWALTKKAIAEGRENVEGTEPTVGFWAPYTEYTEGEYRMYYCATRAFGSSESRIWLATSDHPEGPFENRGIVMDTWHTSDQEPNAIDPHICDTESGRKFLIYGSFFTGIFIKELDVRTGMPKDADPRNQGSCIARKPENSYIDGPEGASVIYNPETKYYYLFLSYGWLGDDYDIRVGRSKEITGPYVDYKGNNLKGMGLGTKLAGSYRFKAGKPYAGGDKAGWVFDGFRGPGHGVPFFVPAKKEYFFVHHVRDGAQIFCTKYDERESYEMHYMVIRRMYFVEGWPLFSPEPYAGEPAEWRKLSDHMEEAEKKWEWILLKADENTIADSVVSRLPKELLTEKTYLFPVFDYENCQACQALSGYTAEGQIVWAKLSP